MPVSFSLPRLISYARDSRNAGLGKQSFYVRARCGPHLRESLGVRSFGLEHGSYCHLWPAGVCSFWNTCSKFHVRASLANRLTRVCSF